MVGCDEKTFRKWAWFYSECVADLESKYVSWVEFNWSTIIYNQLQTSTGLTSLHDQLIFLHEQIRWEHRFCGGDYLNWCLASVDGTDFRIAEPVPFKKVWWTPKFNGPALRYEMACSLHNGDIVWYNGPFAPRSNPDITIFRYKLRGLLTPTEQVICDKGYWGDTKCCMPYQAKKQIPLEGNEWC